MKVTFLGQGYEPESKNAVGNYLLKFLSQPTFHSFIGMSAFASEVGVYGLSIYIEKAKQHLEKIVLIVGIDQEGTSKEALEEILALNIDSYIFYQEESPIFHPKIYLFEGDEEVKLIVGSSNLTGKGLYTNVESSLLIEFDTNDDDGIALLSELKTYYQSLFDFTDANLFKISNLLINDFVVRGIVPEETERRKFYRKRKINTEKENAIGNDGLNIPARQTAKIAVNFPKKERKTRHDKIKNKDIVTEVVNEVTTTVVDQPIQLGDLVWTRKKLPASSVQQTPVGKDTGGLRLVQDGFIVNNEIIDQTDYFRNKIFKSFNWKKIKDNPFVEVTQGSFTVIIKGDNLGKYNLEIRHKPSGVAGQGNYTTSISWGVIGEMIKELNLTGLRLDLYSLNEENSEFRIEVT